VEGTRLDGSLRTARGARGRSRAARRRQREAASAWEQLAASQELAGCTFAPATGHGRVRYRHIVPRGRVDVRRTLAQRVMDEQRFSFDTVGSASLAASLSAATGGKLGAGGMINVPRSARKHMADAERKRAATQRASRQLLSRAAGAATPLAHSFRKGAFRVDDPESWTFEGTIKYRHCRQGVSVPSGWAAGMARQICGRSAAKPDVWLQLEHVFGYSGPKNIQPNVFFTQPRPQEDGSVGCEVLYYTSAVGILYNPRTNTQRFYIGEPAVSILGSVHIG
jgi:hypothetical protein